MDRVNLDYPILIKQLLTAHADLLNRGLSNLQHREILLAFDDERQQYLLRKLGWTDESRLRQTVLHVTLKANKIWIEEDWTENGLATDLQERGVPNQDIVLAFHPPEMRPYTEFAVE